MLLPHVQTLYVWLSGDDQHAALEVGLVGELLARRYLGKLLETRLQTVEIFLCRIAAATGAEEH